MSFCTAINCMDGRVQEQANKYLKNFFEVKYVDTITEPGPNGIIAKNENTSLVDSINHRVSISVNKHGSSGIAIIGHHDCAGNPVDDKTQNDQTLAAVSYLSEKYPEVKVIGLWINSNWEIEEL